MTTSVKAAALLTILFASGAPAGAATVSVQPGKWEVRTDVRIPMMPEPKTETTVDCVRTGELGPEDFLDESAGCEVTDQTASGQTLRWEMECEADGGDKAKGTGTFTATATGGSGTMRMEMEVQGHPFLVLTTWSARRLGDCD